MVYLCRFNLWFIILPPPLQWCMHYLVILEHIITALNCTMNYQYLVITSTEKHIVVSAMFDLRLLCHGNIMCAIVWYWPCYTKWSSLRYTSITSVSSITKSPEPIIKPYGNVHTTRKEKQEFSHCFLLKCQNKIGKYPFIRLWVSTSIFNTQSIIFGTESFYKKRGYQ